ncbi:MAG: hypothetical protein ACKO0Z_20245 [Betaproteobacteria bacterium]
MNKPIIKYQDFQKSVRDNVLAALDSYAKGFDAYGWTDVELPALFKGLEPHIKAMAVRLNEPKLMSRCFISEIE